MYVWPNYKTLKELREALERGEEVTVFDPGLPSGKDKGEWTVSVEGPHYPAPHKWYAMVKIKDGVVQSMIKTR